ncbi:hypothetical protein [Demequina globuliformis]|uniref:hypothetical protein n=1 Tax=Demequina globuliformis TaxID=676202 RepID=UPI0007836CFE|nr:hypothetical protein [Demequina globuliformis]
MWTVTASDVGNAAWSRLQRDGLITPLGPLLALPADIPHTPALRRAALSPHVVPGRFVSGAAALWVHVGGAAPRVIDQCSAHARHDRQAWSPWPSRHHLSDRPGDPPGFAGDTPAADGAALRVIHAVPVASPARALIDALRWDELPVAIDCALRARSIIGIGEIEAEFHWVSTHDRSRARAASAWQMLRSSSLFTGAA